MYVTFCSNSSISHGLARHWLDGCKPFFMKAIGIVLIVAGILMLIFKGFSFTKEKKVLDVGPLEVNKQEQKTVAWPLWAGGIAIVAGAIVLVAGRREKA